METTTPTSPSTVSTVSSEIPMTIRSPPSRMVSTDEEESTTPLFDSPTRQLIQTTPVKKPSHRRAFSTDLDM